MPTILARDARAFVVVSAALLTGLTAICGCAKQHGPVPYSTGPGAAVSTGAVIDSWGMESGGGVFYFMCDPVQGVSERQAANRLLRELESDGESDAWLLGGWRVSDKSVRLRDVLHGCLKHLTKCGDCPPIFSMLPAAERDTAIDAQIPILRAAVQRMGDSVAEPSKDRTRVQLEDAAEAVVPGCKVPVVGGWAVSKQGGRLLFSCTLVEGVSKRDAVRCLFESLEFNSTSDAWLADGWDATDSTIRLRDALYGCLKHLSDCRECPNLKAWVSPEERDVTIRLYLPKLCDAMVRMHRDP